MTQPDPAVNLVKYTLASESGRGEYHHRGEAVAVVAALRDAGWRAPEEQDRTEQVTRDGICGDPAPLLTGISNTAGLVCDLTIGHRSEWHEGGMTTRTRWKHIGESNHPPELDTLWQQRDEAITERDRLRAEIDNVRDKFHDSNVRHAAARARYAAERDHMRPVVEAARDVIEVIRPNVGTLFGTARAAGERFIAAVDAYDAQPKATGGVIDPANLVDTSGGGCVFPPFAREGTRTDG